MNVDRAEYVMIFMRVWESTFAPHLYETPEADVKAMIRAAGNIADTISGEVSKRFTECAWSLDEDDRSWNGTCGIKWCLTESGPEHNQMAFCPHCGRPLKEVKP